MSREGNLAKNAGVLALGTFFPKAAIFITLPILTACMTQEEYGTYDLVQTLVSLLLPAATLQIQSAAFRFLLDAEEESEKRDIISNIYLFSVPVSTVVLGILWFCLGSLSPAVKLAICVYFFMNILFNTNLQIIRGLSSNKTYAIGAFIQGCVQILSVLVLVMLFRQGLVGGLCALICGELMSSIYLFLRGRLYQYINISCYRPTTLKRMLAYSWPMVPNSLSQWVMHVSDRFVISLIMGVSANAVYAVAYKLPSLLSFAQLTFNMAWQENATVVSKDKDAAQYYSAMFRTFFDLVAGCMAILVGVTPWLFRILIQGEYSDGYPQIAILYFGILFHCLSAFWGGIYVAYMKTRIVAVTTIAAAMINLLIDIGTMRSLGLYAASLSTLISYFFLCLFRMLHVQTFLKLKYELKHIFMILALLAVLCRISMLQLATMDLLNLVVGTIAFVLLNRNLLETIGKKIQQRIG